MKGTTTTRATDRLADASTDVSLGAPLPIGSRITEAGLRFYEPGAHHELLLTSLFDGGACVATGPASNAVAVCNDLDEEGAALLTVSSDTR